MKHHLASLAVIVLCAAPASLARPRAAGGLDLVVTSAADAGPGTLRQAILDANASPGPDAIRFAIPASAPVRIALASELPVIAEAVTLDATTQSGSDGRPGVELAGEETLSQGLAVSGEGSVVRGFVVNGFTDRGIALAGANHVVEGCYVGTDATGAHAVPNGVSGIYVHDNSSGMRIGGTSEAARNVVSGNGGDYRYGGGVYVRYSRNTVVQGNYIGTDATGARPLGNTGAGVRFEHSYPSLVGGADAGAPNRIAYNLGPGVAGDRGIQITVSRNSIFENGDNVDNATGFYGIHYSQYNIQSHPTVTFVGAEGDGTRVRGGLYVPRYQGSPAPPTVRLELFRNRACGDLSEFGQGETFVAAFDETFDSTGLVTFSYLLPIQLGPGEVVTATATGPDGTTSYFSQCAGESGGCELPFVRHMTYNASVPVGQPAPLAVEVSGSSPISYQWFRIVEGQSTPISGATSATYTPPDDHTAYKVVATNACGSVTAYPLVWRCSVEPAISEQPESATIPVGSSKFLYIVVAAPEFVAVQWYEGQRGDTSKPVLSRSTEFQTPQLSETTSYWARVTNGCGTVDSETATITVVPRMEITSISIKGTGAKAKIVAKGRNIGRDLIVYVEGNAFEKPARASANKATQRGPLRDGRTIDEAIPHGATVRIDFGSEERGYLSFAYTRP